jgi:hypothetical protein
MGQLIGLGDRERRMGNKEQRIKIGKKDGRQGTET